MSRIAVIYKSKYGSTRKYALWIAEELGATLIEATQVKHEQLMSYDTVIFGGGVYAGSINGLDKIIKAECKRLAVFTVGIANPANTDYSELLKKNFPKTKPENLKVFHLRGALDYSKLSLLHKGAMAVINKMVARAANVEQSGEVRALQELKGQSADFTKKDAVAPIIEYVRNKPV